MSKKLYPSLEEILNRGRNAGSRIANGIKNAGANIGNAVNNLFSNPTQNNTSGDVLYTPGSQAPTTPTTPTTTPPTTPTTTTAAPTTSSASNGGVLYTPGSQAPTNGNPLTYAQWLFEKSIYDAEQMRQRAEKQAETDRQRAIVDANSAYQQGLATYGANAEAMAGMGLSGSGYGEYLTGKAYATQRSDVQNANVTAQARKDQALYEENSAKTTASQIYAQDLINIQNQQNADYSSLYNSALSGASLDSLMQDGRWGNLTTEQQNIIKQATTVNSLKGRIEGGATLEELQALPEWSTLTVDAQQQLENYYNGISESKSEDTERSFLSSLSGIRDGSLSLEAVQSMSFYSNLTESQKHQLQTAYNDRQDAIFQGFKTLIENGDYTYDEIKTMEGFSELSDVLRRGLEHAYKTRNTVSKNEYTQMAQNALNLGNIYNYVKYSVMGGTMTKTEASSYLFENYKSNIESGNFDLREINNAKAEGYLFGSDYDNLRTIFSDNFDTSSNTFVASDGSILKYSDAKELKNQLIGSGLLTPEKQSELNHQFENTYHVYKGSAMRNPEVLTDIGIETKGISYIVDTTDGDYYTAETVELCKDETVYQAAEDNSIQDNAVFVYQGDAYVKRGEKIYKIQSYYKRHRENFIKAIINKNE